MFRALVARNRVISVRSPPKADLPATMACRAARILGAGLVCCWPPMVHAWHDWTIDLEQIPPEDRLLESQWASLPLVAAHALPLPGGGLCVAETTIHRVRLLTRGGAHLRKIGSYRGRGPMEWHHPSALAEAHGMLYVTDSGNGRVQKINITDGNDTVVGFAHQCGHELDKLNFPSGAGDAGVGAGSSAPGQRRRWRSGCTMWRAVWPESG